MLAALIITVGLALPSEPSCCSGCKVCTCKVCDCAKKYDDLQKSVWFGNERIMVIGEVEGFKNETHFPSGYAGLEDGAYKCFNQGGKWMIRLLTQPPQTVWQGNPSVWTIPVSASPVCRT